MSFATVLRVLGGVCTLVSSLASVVILGLSAYFFWHPQFDYEYVLSMDPIFSETTHTFTQLSNILLYIVMTVSCLQLIVSLLGLIFVLCTSNKSSRPAIICVIVGNVIIVLVLIVCIGVGFGKKNDFKKFIREGLSTAKLLGFSKYIIPMQQHLRCCGVEAYDTTHLACPPESIGRSCLTVIYSMLDNGYAVGLVLTILSIACHILASVMLVPGLFSPPTRVNPRMRQLDYEPTRRKTPNVHVQSF